MDEAMKRLRAQAGADLALPLPGARIVIHKRARRLELYAGERLIKSCAVTLGRHADQGSKDAKGDGCTPEGRYFICTRNGASRFHLFLGLNYPNATDAARGLEKKLIDEAQRAAITAAEAAQKRPPWDTRMGGEIGIHGGGTQPPDWTMGCIAVENADIEELWVATEYWTPVEIREE
jgi:murein L,D-transpeptidase YafK